MKGKIPFLFIFIVFISVFSIIHGFSKKKKTVDCSKYIMQLENVIKTMCDGVSGNGNFTLRDACLGCFQVALTADNNQPSLTQMRTCASNYLMTSNYSVCINSIQEAASNEVGATKDNCKTGYCGFVRCVRGVTSDLLIWNCYNMTIPMGMPPMYASDQVAAYKNITSCILATTRCSTINPITGETQSNRISSTKWGKPSALVNALQITSDARLRIVAFPTSASTDKTFCARGNEFAESTWMNYTC